MDISPESLRVLVVESNPSSPGGNRAAAEGVFVSGEA